MLMAYYDAYTALSVTVVAMKENRIGVAYAHGRIMFNRACTTT